MSFHGTGCQRSESCPLTCAWNPFQPQYSGFPMRVVEPLFKSLATEKPISSPRRTLTAKFIQRFVVLTKPQRCLDAVKFLPTCLSGLCPEMFQRILSKLVFSVNVLKSYLRPHQPSEARYVACNLQNKPPDIWPRAIKYIYPAYVDS